MHNNPNITFTICPASQDLKATWFVLFKVGDRRIKKYGSLAKMTTLHQKLKEADRIITGFMEEYKVPDIKDAVDKLMSAKNIISGVMHGNKDIDIKAITHAAGSYAANTDMIKKIELALDTRSLYVRPKSAKTYKHKVVPFLRWFREVTRQKNNGITLENAGFLFIKHLKDDKCLSHKTINSYHGILESFFKEAKIDVNPFKDIRLFRENSESFYYFDNDLQKVLAEQINSINPELWLACQFQYYLLLRPNELRNIKCGAFNLAKKLVMVPGNISKNGKTMPVAIPDALLDQLQFIKDAKPSDYVFGRLKAGKVLASDKPHGGKYFPEAHQEIIKQLGLDNVKYKFYSWKHTGAVMYYKATYDVKGLKEQGRWHSLDMVNEYLKNLGVLQDDKISQSFPAIGANTMKRA